MRPLVLLTIVGLLAMPALADWDPSDGHKMHWPQMPDENGWDVNITYFQPEPPHRVVADDWECSQTGPVTDIHFWGSWQGDMKGEIEWIDIEIYDNIPANPPEFPYSQPGTLLWYQSFHPGEWTERLWGAGEQGWYDPWWNIWWLFDHFEIWQYNITDIPVPGAFEQEEGEIYWLAIYVRLMEGSVGEFGWKTSLDHFMDDAVWGEYPSPMWNELFDPENGESLDMAFVITGEEEPGEEFRFEFSLDIGSDTEMSDPVRDGDEGFDPGDVYWWQGPPVVFPGRDGFKDDGANFAGMDPRPDPPDPNYATAVPVGFGSIQDYWEYFDLDGHDQIDIDLTDAYYPFYPVPSQCIWEVYYLLFSYDDDMRDGWPFPAGDVPVTAPSSAGIVYGTTFGKDEVWGINLVPLGGPGPYPIQVVYPYADEVTVHASLAPNPDFMEEDDDDVDSLDVVEYTGTSHPCPFWYFSADHEAMLGLDPGDIYLFGPGGPVPVIDDVFHLGLLDDTDVDAFEFVWLIDAELMIPVLGIVFSVDEDDMLTPGVNESGGLDPRMIYASSMTGWYWPLLDEDRLWDDVDALTAWHTALGGCPNPGASGKYCVADCFPNDGDGVWDYAVDGDCKINLQDLAQLLANYGTTVGATREDGDVFPANVGDGAVDIRDLAELLSQYNDDCN